MTSQKKISLVLGCFIFTAALSGCPKSPDGAGLGGVTSCNSDGAKSYECASINNGTTRPAPAFSLPQFISEIYSYTYGSVTLDLDANTGTYLAAWLDASNNQYPTYSFYTPGTGWSPIDTITNTSGGVTSSNVSVSSNPSTGTFLATWTDSITNYPMASFYTPGIGWSSASSISTASAATVNSTNTFDASTGQFIATWSDTSNNYYPTYSFYSSGAWSTYSTISVASRAANIYVSYDSANSDLMAVWTDINTGQPKSAHYSSGTWGVATTVAPSASVDNDVLIASDSHGGFMAVWADINQSLYPFYSIYTPGSGWSTSATITTSSGVTDDVALSYDSVHNQYLATWSDDSNGAPTYSFYGANTGWSEPAAIPGAPNTSSDIYTCFNPATDQFLAVWSDRSNSDFVYDPTYSFYSF